MRAIPGLAVETVARGILFAVPPVMGNTYSCPSRSKTMVLLSGDTSRDIRVPSSVSNSIVLVDGSWLELISAGLARGTSWRDSRSTWGWAEDSTIKAPATTPAGRRRQIG